MARKIIIGIHGLRNKPAEKLLKCWWKKAINEGLTQIDANYSFRHVPFELTYWAHMLYSDPQDINIKDENHPLFIHHPYAPAPEAKEKFKPSNFRQKYLGFLETIMDWIFFAESRFLNLDSFSARLIRKKFSDLEFYYREDNVELFEKGLHAKSVIQGRLIKILKKHKRKDILLLAHSMGSVVAYDVLAKNIPGIRVHTFVTSGSPLGLPTVKKKIFKNLQIKSNRKLLAPTPGCITGAWYNLSDLNDTIALNYNLNDDFKPNDAGIGPQDSQINNDYFYKGHRNHHNIYGYLRVPEMAQIINNFLGEKLSLPHRIWKYLFVKEEVVADEN